MTAGLLIVATALFLQSRLTVHSGYGLLLPGFILMGVGMGLVMSPMSTAAMNAVDRTKAGVASGVLAMSRMVGGTFGVAIMGALVTAIGKSKIDQGLPHLPAATRSAIANALGSGAAPTGDASAHVTSVVREAFISALGTGLTIGAAVTLMGAIVAFTLVQRVIRAAEPEGANPPSTAAPEAAEQEPDLTLA
jgi:Na+-transporting methylmalonyl-CoA/oxaloacetate decarboxylase gamma subunit